MFYGLTKAGIKLEKMHHEVAPGQYEFILKHDDPLKIADSLQLAKIFDAILSVNKMVIPFHLCQKPIAGEKWKRYAHPLQPLGYYNKNKCFL